MIAGIGQNLIKLFQVKQLLFVLIALAIFQTLSSSHSKPYICFFMYLYVLISLCLSLFAVSTMQWCVFRYDGVCLLWTQCNERISLFWSLFAVSTMKWAYFAILVSVCCKQDSLSVFDLHIFVEILYRVIRNCSIQKHNVKSLRIGKRQLNTVNNNDTIVYTQNIVRNAFLNVMMLCSG